MNRGYLGTMPTATERDDETYLDFVEGVRIFNAAKVGPVMGDRSSAIYDAESATMPPAAMLDRLMRTPIVASRNRIQRTSQEMMWQGVVETYEKRRPELLAELDVSDRGGPGSVQWDPNFPYPSYFSSVDYHVQPGGYYGDPLAGYVYHYGTKVFFTGKNNNDDVQRALVQASPLPADGQARRILDLACAIGQSTTAWKERVPGAEVWGIDAGAPMVRYAHKRAIDMGIEIHYRQALAEETGFPDGAFDIVYAYILFHEIPLAIGERVVHEAHRLLRPGGIFVVVDAGNVLHAKRSGREEVIWAWETRDNGEPYMGEFVYSDFQGLLRRVFSSVVDNATPGAFLPMRVATR